MTLPDRLLTIPPIDPGQLVLRGPDLEQKLGRWAASVPLEMDHTSTATVTVSLVEQEPGELLEEMAGFFKRDAKTGIRRLKRWNVLRLHDTNYVLAVMRRTASGLDLDFYDEASEDLKRYTGPLKWSRGRFTRAQGVKGLANEAGVLSYIPDQNTKVPIADLSKADRKDLTRSDRVEGIDRFDRIYPAHFIDQAAGHVKLRAEQVRAIAEDAGLPPLAFTQIAQGESGYYPGVVQRDPGDGNIGYGLFQITPHAWNGDKRLLDKLKSLGGTTGMRNPIRCAAMAKFMFDISNVSPWTTSKFLTADARAEAATFKSSDTKDSGNVDRAYVERFEFAIGARERYWDAIERLGGDVRWRRFAAFNHLVFASDFTLAAIRPYELDPSDGWIDDPGQWVVSRDEAIDELPISGRLAAIVPPGTAFAVTENDPLYGTWLVRSFKRDLLDPDCHVDLTLGRPVAPLPEPASTVKRRADRDTSDTTAGNATGLRAKIVAAAEASMSGPPGNTGYNYYYQGTLLTADPTPPPTPPYRSDCSQWTRAIYLKAGAPDPGINTWAQDAKGRRTKDPKPGDLVLYENHDHVELFIGNGRTIGHGSAPIDYGVPDQFGDGAYHFVTFDFLDD